jgi:alkaline phosphatase D
LLVLGSCHTDVKKQIKQFENPKDSVFKIAFGSCNKQDLPNVMWPIIVTHEPDLWIWGGDNIYADTEDMEVLESQYELQKANKLYADFESKIEIMGTWDDHDYGENDAGEYYPKKKESQQLFLDFMNVSKNDPRRKQDGVYTSRTFKVGHQNIKIITLDTRFFRSNLTRDPNPEKKYKANEKNMGTMLGNRQWEWLANEIAFSDATFNIIVSSIQVLSGEHGYEGWFTMPHEIEKLENLLQKHKSSNCIILSGDRHISEISKKMIDGLEYPLIDFTSSGLTHAFSNFTEEPNRYRIGEVVKENSFGILTFNLNAKEVVMEMINEDNIVLQTYTQNYQ